MLSGLLFCSVLSWRLSTRNVFHAENGGFLSFFSSGLRSGSIAGLSPVDATISRNVHAVSAEAT